MKAWIQRVTEASVWVEGEEIAQIGRGYVLLLGVRQSDCEEGARKLARRVSGLRLFEDEKGLTNLSLDDVEGEILVISQFTLYADLAHGRRPSFGAAARGEMAYGLYELFVKELKGMMGEGRVQTGKFGAHMQVKLVNDGPFSVEVLG